MLDEELLDLLYVRQRPPPPDLITHPLGGEAAAALALDGDHAVEDLSDYWETEGDADFTAAAAAAAAADDDFNPLLHFQHEFLSRPPHRLQLHLWLWIIFGFAFAISLVLVTVLHVCQRVKAVTWGLRQNRQCCARPMRRDNFQTSASMEKEISAQRPTQLAVALLRDQLTAAQSMMHLKRRQSAAEPWCSDIREHSEDASLASWRSPDTYTNTLPMERGGAGNRAGDDGGRRVYGVGWGTLGARTNKLSREGVLNGGGKPALEKLSLGKDFDGRSRGKPAGVDGGSSEDKTVSAEFLSPLQQLSLLANAPRRPEPSVAQVGIGRWPLWASPFLGLDVRRILGVVEEKWEATGREATGLVEQGGGQRDKREGNLSRGGKGGKEGEGETGREEGEKPANAFVAGCMKGVGTSGRWRPITRGRPLIRRRQKSIGRSQCLQVSSAARNKSMVSLEIATSDLLQGDFSKIRVKYSEPPAQTELSQKHKSKLSGRDNSDTPETSLQLASHPPTRQVCPSTVLNSGAKQCLGDSLMQKRPPKPMLAAVCQNIEGKRGAKVDRAEQKEIGEESGENGTGKEGVKGKGGRREAGGTGGGITGGETRKDTGKLRRLMPCIEKARPPLPYEPKSPENDQEIHHPVNTEISLAVMAHTTVSPLKSSFEMLSPQQASQGIVTSAEISREMPCPLKSNLKPMELTVNGVDRGKDLPHLERILGSRGSNRRDSTLVGYKKSATAVEDSEDVETNKPKSLRNAKSCKTPAAKHPNQYYSITSSASNTNEFETATKRDRERAEQVSVKKVDNEDPLSHYLMEQDTEGFPSPHKSDQDNHQALQKQRKKESSYVSRSEKTLGTNNDVWRSPVTQTQRAQFRQREVANMHDKWKRTRNTRLPWLGCNHSPSPSASSAGAVSPVADVPARRNTQRASQDKVAAYRRHQSDAISSTPQQGSVRDTQSAVCGNNHGSYKKTVAEHFNGRRAANDEGFSSNTESDHDDWAKPKEFDNSAQPNFQAITARRFKTASADYRADPKEVLNGRSLEAISEDSRELVAPSSSGIIGCTAHCDIREKKPIRNKVLASLVKRKVEMKSRVIPTLGSQNATTGKEKLNPTEKYAGSLNHCSGISLEHGLLLEPGNIYGRYDQMSRMKERQTRGSIWKKGAGKISKEIAYSSPVPSDPLHHQLQTLSSRQSNTDKHSFKSRCKHNFETSSDSDRISNQNIASKEKENISRSWRAHGRYFKKLSNGRKAQDQNGVSKTEQNPTVQMKKIEAKQSRYSEHRNFRLSKTPSAPHTEHSTPNLECSTENSGSDIEHNFQMTEPATRLVGTHKRGLGNRWDEVCVDEKAHREKDKEESNLSTKVADSNRGRGTNENSSPSSEVAGRIDLTLRSHRCEPVFPSQRSISVCAQASMATSLASPTLVSEFGRISSRQQKREATPEKEIESTCCSKNESKHIHDASSGPFKMEKIIISPKCSGTLDKSGRTRSDQIFSSRQYQIPESSNALKRSSREKTTADGTVKDKVNKNKQERSFRHQRHLRLNRSADVSPISAAKLQPEYRDSLDKSSLIEMIRSCANDEHSQCSSSPHRKSQLHSTSPRQVDDITDTCIPSANASDLSERTSLTPGLEGTPLPTGNKPDLTAPKRSLCSPKACRLHGSDVRYCLCENRPVHEMISHQQYTMEELRHAGYSFFKDEIGSGSIPASLRGNSASAGAKSGAAPRARSVATPRNERGGLPGSFTAKADNSRKPENIKHSSLPEKDAVNSTDVLNDRQEISLTSARKETSNAGDILKEGRDAKELSCLKKPARGGVEAEASKILLNVPITKTSQQISKREMMRQIREKIKKENQAARETTQANGAAKRERTGRWGAVKTTPPSQENKTPIQKSKASDRSLPVDNKTGSRYESTQESNKRCNASVARLRRLIAFHDKNGSLQKKTLQKMGQPKVESQLSPTPKQFRFGKLRGWEVQSEKSTTNTTVKEIEENRQSSPSCDTKHMRSSQCKFLKQPQLNNQHTRSNVSTSNNVSTNRSLFHNDLQNFDDHKANHQITDASSNGVKGFKSCQNSRMHDQLPPETKGSCVKSKFPRKVQPLNGSLKLWNLQSENKESVSRKNKMYGISAGIKSNSGVKENGEKVGLGSKENSFSKTRSQVKQTGGRFHDAEKPGSNGVCLPELPEVCDVQTAKGNTLRGIASAAVNNPNFPSSPRRQSFPRLKTLVRSKQRLTRQGLYRDAPKVLGNRQSKQQIHRERINPSLATPDTKQDASQADLKQSFDQSECKNIHILNTKEHPPQQDDIRVTRFANHKETEHKFVKDNKTDAIPRAEKLSLLENIKPSTINRNKPWSRLRQRPPLSQFHGKGVSKEIQSQPLDETRKSKLSSQKSHTHLKSAGPLQKHPRVTTNAIGHDSPSDKKLLPSLGLSKPFGPLSQKIALLNVTNPDVHSQGRTLEVIRDSNLVLTCTEIDCPETKSYRKTKLAWSISPESAEIHSTKHHVGKLRENQREEIMTPPSSPTAPDKAPTEAPSQYLVKSEMQAGKGSILQAMSSKNHEELFSRVSSRNTGINKLENTSVRVIDDNAEFQNISTEEKVTEDDDELNPNFPELLKITSEDAENFKLPDTLPSMIGGNDLSDQTISTLREKSLQSKRTNPSESLKTVSRRAFDVDRSNYSLSVKKTQVGSNFDRAMNDLQDKPYQLELKRKPQATAVDDRMKKNSGEVLRNSPRFHGGSPVFPLEGLGDSGVNFSEMETPVEESTSMFGLTDLAMTSARKGLGRKRRTDEIEGTTAVRKYHKVEKDCPGEHVLDDCTTKRLSIEQRDIKRRNNSDIGTSNKDLSHDGGSRERGRKRPETSADKDKGEKRMNVAEGEEDRREVGQHTGRDLVKSKSHSQSQSHSCSLSRGSQQSATGDSATNTLERLLRRRLVTGRSHRRFGGSASPKSINEPRSFSHTTKKPSTPTDDPPRKDDQPEISEAGICDTSKSVAFKTKSRPRSRSLFASTEDAGYVTSAAHHSLRHRGFPQQLKHQKHATGMA